MVRRRERVLKPEEPVGYPPADGYVPPRTVLLHTLADSLKEKGRDPYATSARWYANWTIDALFGTVHQREIGEVYRSSFSLCSCLLHAVRDQRVFQEQLILLCFAPFMLRELALNKLL